MGSKETPQEQREKLRQKELKNNPTGNLHDALNRTNGGGNLTDLTGGMSWKDLGMVIILLVLGYVIYKFVSG